MNKIAAHEFKLRTSAHISDASACRKQSVNGGQMNLDETESVFVIRN